MVWVVILAVFGLALVVAEVFFPSMGVLSILAAVCLVSSVVLAFQEGEATGITVLVLAAIAAPLVFWFAFRMLPRTGLGKNLLLDAGSMEGTNRGGQQTGLEHLLHKKGETVSALRPAGFARIDGRRVDVVTRGNHLALGEPVVVVEVEGNRVVVARDDTASNESP